MSDPAHRSSNDGAEGSLPEPKRAKITLHVWVKVRGGGDPMPYPCDEHCIVGVLLREVQDREKIAAPLGQLKLFPSESKIDDPSKASRMCADI